jgi:hydroxymethylbilane synthase
MKQFKRRLIVGTRASKMARAQTDFFVSEFLTKFPQNECTIVPITVSGERDYARPIAELGIEGVFIKELEEALLNKEVDLVVHSLKDLTTTLPSALALACVYNRIDPRDVLVSQNNVSFADLPTGSRVATSSRRRMAQLRALRSDLSYMDIRGNVPTRIEKLDDGYCDAIVLAAAGLIRLGLDERIAQFFDLEISLPAPGQGALGIECRADDTTLLAQLNALDDPEARFAVTAERSFLSAVGGGCSMPIGAYAKLIAADTILLTACITSLDGKEMIKGEMTAHTSEAESLGKRLAKLLLEQGAQKIVEQLRLLSPATVSPP